VDDLTLRTDTYFFSRAHHTHMSLIDIKEGFDEELLKRWHGMPEKLFRSFLRDTSIEPLEGKWGIAKGYSPARSAAKRMSTIDGVKEGKSPQVVSTWNPKEFNFTKAAPEECFASLEGEPVLINVSPLMEGHCIVVPRIKECLPQVLTKEALLLGLRWAQLSKRSDFRVLFNSLGAYASVNHLHLHGGYFGAIFPTGSLPLSKDLNTEAPFLDWFVRGMTCFEDVHEAFRFIELLQKRNIAHNLIITPNGETFIFARRIQGRACSLPGITPVHGGVRMAVVECMGYLVCHDEGTFKHLTEENLPEFVKELCLSEEELSELWNTFCAEKNA